MTNAEARFNNFLRPRKPEGSLGRTAQDSTLTQLLNYECDMNEVWRWVFILTATQPCCCGLVSILIRQRGGDNVYSPIEEG